MKFSIGDKVLLKRTGEEGCVVAFLSKVMMEVEVAGTRFPVYNDEVDHPYLTWFTNKKRTLAKRQVEQLPVEKPLARRQRLARGIYILFIPQFAAGVMDDIIESFQIHLINETPDVVSFRYQAKSASGISIFQHKTTLHAFGHIYLHPLSLEDMNGQPRFHWEVAVAKSDKPVKGILRIRPAQLIRYIQEMLAQNNPSFSILLAQDAEQTVTTPVEQPTSVTIENNYAQQARPQIVLHTEPEVVVDLHIAALGAGTTHMNPEEILSIQLSALEQKLQAAMASGLREMIVIHGLGKGILKQKVHELLAAQEGVQSFSNHWMGAYGWGATQIVFATY